MPHKDHLGLGLYQCLLLLNKQMHHKPFPALVTPSFRTLSIFRNAPDCVHRCWLHTKQIPCCSPIHWSPTPHWDAHEFCWEMIQQTTTSTKMIGRGATRMSALVKDGCWIIILTPRLFMPTILKCVFQHEVQLCKWGILICQRVRVMAKSSGKSSGYDPSVDPFRRLWMPASFTLRCR